MLDLYKNIKKYRTESKLTQQELAEKAGYKDKSMIAKIEKGLVDLPQSKIKLFAEIFGVTQSDLMGYTSSDSEFTRRTISLFSGIGELSKDLLLQQDGYLPGIQIVQPNGKVKTFDTSSLVYSIMESVSEMPPEQLELVNNMVGGKKIHIVENPQNRKKSAKEIAPHLLPNAANDRTDIEVTEEMKKEDDSFFDED